MKISVETSYDVLIVNVSGILDSGAVGPLGDTFAEYVREGWRKIVVDLAHLRSVTRAGVRGLVVATKLLHSLRGEVRICHADAQTEAFLKAVSYHHLLRFDPNRQAVFTALSVAGQRTTPSDAQAAIRVDQRTLRSHAPQIGLGRLDARRARWSAGHDRSGSQTRRARDLERAAIPSTTTLTIGT